MLRRWVAALEGCEGDVGCGFPENAAYQERTGVHGSDVGCGFPENDGVGAIGMGEAATAAAAWRVGGSRGGGGLAVAGAPGNRVLLPVRDASAGKGYG